MPLGRRLFKAERPSHRLGPALNDSHFKPEAEVEPNLNEDKTGKTQGLPSRHETKSS